MTTSGLGDRQRTGPGSQDLRGRPGRSQVEALNADSQSERRAFSDSKVPPQQIRTRDANEGDAAKKELPRRSCQEGAAKKELPRRSWTSFKRASEARPRSSPPPQIAGPLDAGQHRRAVQCAACGVARWPVIGHSRIVSRTAGRWRKTGARRRCRTSTWRCGPLPCQRRSPCIPPGHSQPAPAPSGGPSRLP